MENQQAGPGMQALHELANGLQQVLGLVQADRGPMAAQAVKDRVDGPLTRAIEAVRALETRAAELEQKLQEAERQLGEQLALPTADEDKNDTHA